jgi:hypothetical protein
MAKSLLEVEGIEAILSGNLVADTFAGLTGMGDQVVLQVREEDAQRAVGLLAAASAQASLDEDWEAQAEAGVWTCPLCGTAVPEDRSVCPACQSHRTGIQQGPGPRDDLQRPSRREPVNEGIQQARDRIQSSAPSPLPATEFDTVPPKPSTHSGPPPTEFDTVLPKGFLVWLVLGAGVLLLSLCLLMSYVLEIRAP